MAIFDGKDEGGERLAAYFEKWLAGQTGMEQARISAFDAASTSNGYSNRTFRVLVEPGRARPAEKLILRLPPTRKSLFPTYDLPRQFAFMRLLEGEPDLPMGRTRWIESDSSHLGYPFFVVDNVEGMVPPDNPMYHLAGWVYDATPAQRATLWQSTIETLAALSKVRPAPAAREALDWPDRSVSRTRQQIDHWDALARWGAQDLPPADKSGIQERLRLWLIANLPEDDPAGIVWGDSRIGNIIYQDFRPAALLDWELAFIGDPEIDLAYFLIMQLYHETLRPETGLASTDPRLSPRLPGFGNDRESVALYERASGRKVRNLRYYWLLNAYKMYCMAQRMTAMQIELGGVAPETALLIRTLPSLTPHVLEMLGNDAHDALPSASSTPMPARDDA